MISQGLIKIVLPWLFLAMWAFNVRSRRVRVGLMATLYITVLAGFASNFTPFYREMGQVFSILMVLLFFLRIYKRGAIPRHAAPVLALLFLILVSLIVNPSRSTTVVALVNFLVVSAVAVYVVSEIESRAGFEEFARQFRLLGILLAGISVLEGIGLNVRSEGTFSNPNYLGLFLGVAACMTFVGTSGWRRWSSFLIISIGIYYTQSRAAFIMPFLMIVFNFLSIGVRRVVALSPALLLLAALVVFIPFPVGVSQRDDGGSDSERVLALEAGIEMARENPFFGVGWGHFIEEFWSASSRAPVLFPSVPRVETSRRDMVSHNDYVRMFAELGVVAGVYFMFLTWRSFRRVLAMPAGLRMVLAPTLLGLVAFSLTHNNLNSALFWIFFLYPMAAKWKRAPNGVWS